MQIDWFTVVAQIVNFLVLVLLLKRFLYHPVINAMERREQSLKDIKQQADDEVRMAEQQSQLYLNKLQEIEQQKKEMLLGAKQDAEIEKKRLMESIRAEIKELDQQWRLEVVREKQEFLNEGRQKIADEIIKVVRKVLNDLVDSDFNAQMLNLFKRQLLNLSEDGKSKIQSALKESSHQIILQSSFEINSAQVEDVTEILKKITGQELQLKVDVITDMLCGIKLQIPGGVVEWSVENYLDEIEENLSKNLTAAESLR